MRLEISCADRNGITQDVLDVLNEYDIDLRGIEINEEGKIFLDFPSIDFSDFQGLMPKIRKITDIIDVKTTPFMPTQRERNQLSALLQTIPDPVFSIDATGRITLYNDVVADILEMTSVQIKQLNLDDLLLGFNVTKWLQNKNSRAQTCKVEFVQQEYIADILPINIFENDSNIFAGAVIMLKSEVRLGAQLNAFKQLSISSFDNFDAHSTAMKRVLREAKRMSILSANMLIIGATGTGKEQIARACHDSSPFAEGEFVTVNCATMSESEAESELFGHAEGADAYPQGKEGLFTQAAGGTLLFEEVSEMSWHLQSKLLRVLENGTYQQLGDSHIKSVSCRIICTSSKDLAESMHKGSFREDLYYRLNVLGLILPSLHQRKADIVPLANKLIMEHAKKLGIRTPKLSKPCIEYLKAYPWPGNIRQLKNTLYRAISLIEGNEITKEAIQVPTCSANITYLDENFEGTLEQEVKRFERDMLKRLYPSYPSTRQLARKLGLSHTAIANKLREYGISKHSV